MNIAAYCRVSTDKSDQLNSLETQKQFFTEYVQRTGDHLVKVYADEGISGTKIKNRKEFLQMMADAEHGLFDMVVVKDFCQEHSGSAPECTEIKDIGNRDTVPHC